MIQIVRRLLLSRKKRLRLERQAAMAGFKDAWTRGDTRAQHDRWPALFTATNAKLRQEMGRS